MMTDQTTRRETVEEFMARKHDPKWKPKRLPRYKPRLPRMTQAKFAELCEEFHVTHSIVPVERPARAPETVEEFMARKHDPNWKPDPLPRFQPLPRLTKAEFRRLLASNQPKPKANSD